MTSKAYQGVQDLQILHTASLVGQDQEKITAMCVQLKYITIQDMQTQEKKQKIFTNVYYMASKAKYIMWQSQVENVHYSVFNRINLIRSAASILCNFKPEFGILLAGRQQLLKIEFELSGTPIDGVITLQS